jgi:hypothetical protein
MVVTTDLMVWTTQSKDKHYDLEMQTSTFDVMTFDSDVTTCNS